MRAQRGLLTLHDQLNIANSKLLLPSGLIILDASEQLGPFPWCKSTSLCPRYVGSLYTPLIASITDSLILELRQA
jgi:hypothetical protein